MTKKLQPDDVVAEVARRLAENPVGVQPWYKKVKQEHVATLKHLSESWKAGRLGKHRRTAAREIAKLLREQGIANVGIQGVDSWLQRA